MFLFCFSQADSIDIQDKFTEGAPKIVPLGMDEFITGRRKESLEDDLKEDCKSVHNDSGEFPDLLDSENSLATLKSNYDYSQYSTADENLNKILKSPKEESGLTFTNLNGLEPVYPDIDVSSLSSSSRPVGPMVVAKKSAAPSVKSEIECVEIDLGNASFCAIKTELETARIPPPTPLLVDAARLVDPVVMPTPAPGPQPPVLILQGGDITAGDPGIKEEHKKYDDDDDDEDEDEDEDDDDDDDSLSAVKSEGQLQFGGSQVAAVGSSESLSTIGMSSSKPGTPVPGDASKDPTKETFTHTTPSGHKVEVPVIITSGYDFDNLLCLFCDNQAFKNEKTLINHLLSHFGVAPKMATCPVCGLSLQKKSFARHVRLHGDVKPEVCPYCSKEFREKRSLDKHIRAIHEAERPFPCDLCPEAFRNQIELKNHMNRHLKDYPYKCDVCSMTFQKQESLTTHYRLHTGEKPFVCPICDKKFTSEKNKRVHVLRHEGSLPHRCEVCDMTFQSRSHLLKHASSHSRKTQVTVAKINTFLESFGASLEEFGLDDTYDTGNQISLHQATESGEIEDESVKLTMESLSEGATDKLEPGMAEDSFAYSDLTEDVVVKTELIEGEQSRNELAASTSLMSSMFAVSTANSGSVVGAPALVNGLTDEDAERMARAELAVEIPATSDGTHLCQMCNTRLGNRRSYIIHLRRHAGMLNFRCDYCPKTFQGRVKLNRHVNTHFREGGFPPSSPSNPAPVSADSFSAGGQAGGSTVAKEHIAASTTVGAVVSAPSHNFGCGLCSKFFKDKPSLQEHTKMHLIEDAKAKFKPQAREKKVRAFFPGDNLGAVPFEKSKNYNTSSEAARSTSIVSLPDLYSFCYSV